MQEKRKLSRRGLIRLISFIVTLVTILAISTAVGFGMAYRYRTSIEHTYQRALSELTDSVNNITVALDKGKYANTPTQIEGLAAKLWKEADLAKEALAALPVGNEEITSTAKFLSQVGNFCVSVSKKVASGENLTKEEQETLEKLGQYAKETSNSLQTISNRIDVGILSLREVEKKVEDSQLEDFDNPEIISSFKDIEENFASYPSLIYDGPFSDHIMQQKPKFLEGKKEVSESEAFSIAKNITGLSNLTTSGETAGNLPCYQFGSADGVFITVTKVGGVFDTYLNPRQIENPKLSFEEAVSKAEQKLSQMGYKEVAMRYYENNRGVLVINFAAKKDDIIFYPDLIKIGIALDNGDMASFDAKGYILNNHKREVEKPKLSLEEAKKSLSSKLKVKSHALAVVPSGNLKEVLTYEFTCEGDDEENVLVYINAETGMEEQIFVLIIDESGVLAT